MRFVLSSPPAVFQSTMPAWCCWGAQIVFNSLFFIGFCKWCLLKVKNSGEHLLGHAIAHPEELKAWFRLAWSACRSQNMALLSLLLDCACISTLINPHLCIWTIIWLPLISKFSLIVSEFLYSPFVPPTARSVTLRSPDHGPLISESTLWYKCQAGACLLFSCCVSYISATDQRFLCGWFCMCTFVVSHHPTFTHSVINESLSPGGHFSLCQQHRLCVLTVRALHHTLLTITPYRLAAHSKRHSPAE